MAIDPITGNYTSPFSSGAGTFLPSLEAKRHWDNAPGTMVSRALDRGRATVNRNMGSTAEGLGRVTGLGGLEGYGADVVARNTDRIQRSAEMESDTPLDFLVSVLGENAPQLAASVGLPIAGAVIGGLLAGPAGAVAGGAKGFTVARGKAVGMAAGTAASGAFNYALYAGEMREAQKFENDRQGNGKEVDEARAFGTAIPAAALDTLSGVLQAKLAQKMVRASTGKFFAKETAARAARAAATGAAFEGPTEMAQQALVRAQADQSLTDKEAVTEMLMAGLAGAILGGTIGGVSSGIGDARTPREKSLTTTKNEDLIAGVDKVLALPAPPKQLEGPQAPQAPQTPPLELTPEPDTPPTRALDGLPDAQLVVQVQSLEQRALAGQLNAQESQQLTMLREEANARDMSPELFSADTDISTRSQEMFAGQKMQDIRRAKSKLDTKAKKDGLSPEDIQLYRMLDTEIARREDGPKTEAQDTAQPSLFDAANTEDRARADTKKFARENGLATSSKFYKSLKAKNTDELYDEVFDGLEKGQRGQTLAERKAEGDLDQALGNVAYNLGIGRDLQAEAAQAQADTDTQVQQLQSQIDAVAWPTADQAQTPKGVAAFEQAQAQQRELQAQVEQVQSEGAQQVAQIEQLDQRVKDATQRLERREAEAAYIGDKAKAQLLADALVVDEAPISISRKDMTEIAQEAQSDTPFGRRMQQVLTSAQRQEEFDLARTQQQDRQFAEAEAAPDVDTPPVANALENQQRREMERDASREASQQQAAQMKAIADARRQEADAVAEARRQEELRPETPFAKQMRQSLAAAQRREDADRAQTQQQEQRFREAEAAQTEQDIAPTKVLSRKQPRGDTAEIVLSRGAPLRLQRKDNAWYDGDMFVARHLKDAVKAAQRARDTEAGLRPSKARNYMGRADPKDLWGKTSAEAIVAIRAVVARVMKGWDAPYNVYVVSNVDRLPADYVARYNGEGQMYGAGGFMTPDGTVVLLTDNIPHTQEAVAILYHEVLGHIGLQRLFGVNRDAIIMDMYNNSAALRDMHKTWYYETGSKDAMYKAFSKAKQVEEALATLSEGGPIQATFFKRMAAMIRDFARKLGFKMQFSKSEILNIMAEAHRRAVSPETNEFGVAPGPDGVPMQAPRRPVSDFSPIEMQTAANTYGNPSIAGGMLMASRRATVGVKDTPQGADTAIARVMAVAEGGLKKLQAVRGEDFKQTRVKAAVYFSSLGHLRDTYGHYFKMTLPDGTQTNAIAVVETARQVRAAVQNVFSRLATGNISDFFLSSADAQAMTLELAGATYLQLDPSKSLDKHTHLTLAQRERLRPEHARLQATYDKLARKGEIKTYKAMRDLNDATYFMQHALDLFDVVRSIPEVRKNIPAAAKNPVKKFLDAYTEQNDPVQARAFWDKELKTLVSQTRKFVEAQGSRKVSAADAQRVNTMVSALQDQLTRTDTQTKAMEQYPYFHLARFGNYATRFSLPTVVGADGIRSADPKAIHVVADALAKIGIHNVQIDETMQGASVFIRSETIELANKIEAMARELAAEGYVDGNKAIAAQPVDPIELMPENTKKIMAGIMAEIEAANAPLSTDDAATRESKQKHIERVKAEMQAAFLARLPDRSVAKVMTRRGFRAGFDTDMIRGAAQRWELAANAAASRLASNMTSEALQSMRSDVTQANEGNPDRWTMGNVLREMMKREETRQPSMLSPTLDGLRAYNHVNYLAMNPGYWLTQITQMQTNLWPELVKNGASYKDAFGAITSTFPTAFKIVKASIAVAKAQGFAEHGADASVTLQVLETIQLSADPVQDAALKQFVLSMYSTGVIDIGSQMRSLGRISEGKNEGAFDFAMRWAGSGSYYLEVLTRLNAALAGRKVALDQGKTADEATRVSIHVVNQAMLNYGEGNRARAFGKQGLVGEATPLVSAFMTFQFHMTEKYIREVKSAADGAKTAEERAAAQRWIKAHVASMAVLAGTMGLPMVTVIARVIDFFGDFGDSEEPFDIKANYRNFLADTFGEDVGEVIARGIPRAAGFDISGRIGAADYLPFSKFLADRRDWDDRMGSLPERTVGSAYAMAAGWAKGASLVSQGRVLEGMQEAVPVAIRNPLSAMKMTSKGFTDTRGNVLPMDPSVADIVYQAMGLTPARRAEYSEANFGQAQRRGVVGRKASDIRRQIITAVQSGDAQQLRDGLAKAREFDTNVSPQFMIMPNLSSSISQAIQSGQTARGLGAPLGVKPQDIQGRQQTRFANY